MASIYVHPNILQHPGRIETLERNTGMKVILNSGRPVLENRRRKRWQDIMNWRDILQEGDDDLDPPPGAA